MQENYIGEIWIFAGNFAPSGWKICNGEILSTVEYDILFGLIGTTYGGDGINTFALPDLRGRAPLHYGQGTGLSKYDLGENNGVENVTLSVDEISGHQHNIFANTINDPNTNNPQWFSGVSPENVYSTTAKDSISSIQIGGSQPHENMQPYLVLNYIIALSGIYP